MTLDIVERIQSILTSMQKRKLAAIAPFVLMWNVFATAAETPARCDDAINRAKTFSDSKKDAEAAKLLETAIKMCTPPKTPFEKQRLAVAHSRLGVIQYANQPEQSLIHFRKAVELDPANLTGSLNLGAALTRFNSYAEAMSVLEPAIKQGTDDKDLLFKLHYNAGFAMLKMCAERRSGCDAARAEEHFLRASELNPSFPDTWFNLAAFANDVHHDSRRAMQLFKKACDLGHEQGCFQYEHFRSRLDPKRK
jgi:tetratricopeptide (TPR) repeat protein